MDGIGYAELKRGVAAVRLPRDFLVVAGPDAEGYLQGQISQDVGALDVGASAWSFVLQPQGKVDAWFRITKVADERFVLDLDAGSASALTERLNRFKLRTKATIEPLDWDCIAVRGPSTPTDLEAEIVSPIDWGPMQGSDLLGPVVRVPTDIIEATADAYEALRIESGIPMMGREITSDTIPAETGVVERSASFTKGCYTGQELVARVDSRGNNTPRNLRGITFSEAVLPPPNAKLFLGDDTTKSVGWLTSVSESLDLRAPIALAYVGRAVEIGAHVAAVWDGGSTVGVVHSLPLT